MVHHGTRFVRRRTLLLGLAGLACFALCGHATTARAQMAAANLAGCWPCGSWQSYCTGHSGKLRATIVQCDATHFECFFSGNFAKVVPFRYSVVLTVTGEKDGIVYFGGRKEMCNLLGGVYTFSGWSNGREFHAGYVSSKDRGEFAVSR